MPKTLMLSPALAPAAVLSPAALAQDFPNRPVHIVVPWPPSGNVDITARTVAPALAEALGQQVIVENRPGAGGTIGTAAVVKSPARRLHASAGIERHGDQRARRVQASRLRPAQGPDRDRADPVGADGAHRGAENAGVELQGIRRLCAVEARQVSIASAGNGSSNHLAIELLMRQAKLPLLHVPYKGSGPAITDLLGSQVETMMDQLTASIEHIRNGRLKALAVTSLARSPLLPNVPTLDESGVKGYEAGTYTGIFAPAGTPPAVVAKLYGALRKALAVEAVRERYRSMGVEIMDMGQPNSPPTCAPISRSGARSRATATSSSNMNVAAEPMLQPDARPLRDRRSARFAARHGRLPRAHLRPLRALSARGRAQVLAAAVHARSLAGAARGARRRARRAGARQSVRIRQLDHRGFPAGTSRAFRRRRGGESGGDRGGTEAPGRGRLSRRAADGPVRHRRDHGDAGSHRAPRRALGWHIEINIARSSDWVELEPRLRRCPVPLVFDHMGRVRGAEGVNAPGFTVIRRLLAGARRLLDQDLELVSPVRRGARRITTTCSRSCRRCSPSAPTAASGAPTGRTRGSRRTCPTTPTCSICSRAGCRAMRCASRCSRPTRRSSPRPGSELKRPAPRARRQNTRVRLALTPGGQAGSWGGQGRNRGTKPS